MFNKPNVNEIWAQSGLVLTPAGAKISQGWIAEIPDFEFENWIQNRQDRFNAHVNQHGIAVWDNQTEYLSGKSYVQGSDGIVYRATSDNTNTNPVTNPGSWAVAFEATGTSYTKSESDDKYTTKANNLSDLNNAGTARTNLNVYSKTETDGRYTRRANNLSDVTNVATARNNLSVYSKAQTDAAYVAKSANLSDLANVNTARSNLNVYSKSEGDGRYLRGSNNLSDVSSAATSRSNLGLGTAATRNVGTAASNVPSISDADSRYMRGSSNLSEVTNASTARDNLNVYSRTEIDNSFTVASQMVGMIAPFAGTSAPSGWLVCDGSAVSRSTYLALFNRIGTIYGSGNSTTTFNLPDLRGEFIRGADLGRGVDVGRQLNTSQLDQMQRITGNIDIRSRDDGNMLNNATGVLSSAASPNSLPSVSNSSNRLMERLTFDSGDSPNARVSPGTNGETRPRNIALLYCIKT